MLIMGGLDQGFSNGGTYAKSDTWSTCDWCAARQAKENQMNKIDHLPTNCDKNICILTICV